MEKRRIRLEINGVVCGLITEESEEYMQELAKEVGDLMQAIMGSAPFITREAAALTAALSYCDDAKKNAKGASAVPDPALQQELEELKKRAAQLEERNTALEESAAAAFKWEAEAARLEDENAALQQAIQSAPAAGPSPELEQRLKDLEEENSRLKALAEQAEQAKSAVPAAPQKTAEPAPEKTVSPAGGKRKNPLRHEDDFEQQGFVSFFERSGS